MKSSTRKLPSNGLAGLSGPTGILAGAIGYKHTQTHSIYVYVDVSYYIHVMQMCVCSDVHVEPVYQLLANTVL